MLARQVAVSLTAGLAEPSPLEGLLRDIRKVWANKSAWIKSSDLVARLHNLEGHRGMSRAVKGDHPMTDDRKIPDNKIGRRKSDVPTMTDIADYTLPRYREAADIAQKVMQGELPAEMLKVAQKLTAEANKYGREALKARRRSRLAEAPDGRRR